MEKRDSILFVLSELGEAHGRTFLQKLMFILDKKGKFGFDYKPYFYGPFSRELNNLLTALVGEGLVNENLIKGFRRDCYVYTLTEEGKKKAARLTISNSDEVEKKIIQEVCAKFKGFTPTEILRYVYKIYPEMTEESVYTGALD